MESGVGNDLQTTGIEPYLSLPLTNNGPWIQLLNVIDPEEPGWPLITPLKVQMQKCDKCSREFCSILNYRRHIRVHRRSLNADKESCNRDILGAFWDKMSLDESKKILSFDDVILDGLLGGSIIKALEAFVRAPAFCALPQAYVKAGVILLDVIQATPSSLPVSSHEFFSVLDDASEGTFLFGGAAGSVQKYIFDGEAGKVGLEVKNLVACTSFLLEQKLVKAWVADKDAEALRCQKLLIEEEEATQRRQAELLERKRQKKLRRKEQKTMEQSYPEKTNIYGAANMVKNVSSAKPPSPIHQSEGDSHALEIYKASIREHINLIKDTKQYVDAYGGYITELFDIGVAENVELQKSKGSDNQHIVKGKSQVLESKVEHGDLHPSSDLHVVKLDPMQKHAPGEGSSGQKCVTDVSRVADVSQTNHTSFEVMIGSIPVTLRNCTTQRQPVDDSRSEAPEETYGIDHVTCGSISDENQMTNLKAVTSNTSHPVDIIKETISKHGESEDVESGFTIVGPRRGRIRNDGKRNVQPANLSLSNHPARAFLTQRWKEANSADHETLILSQEPQKATDSKEVSILGGSENCSGIMGTKGNAAAKSRKKKT